MELISLLVNIVCVKLIIYVKILKVNEENFCDLGIIYDLKIILFRN